MDDIAKLLPIDFIEVECDHCHGRGTVVRASTLDRDKIDKEVINYINRPIHRHHHSKFEKVRSLNNPHLIAPSEQSFYEFRQMLSDRVECSKCKGYGRFKCADGIHPEIW